MRYPPLRYYLERVLRDMGGVISHWATKGRPLFADSRKVIECFRGRHREGCKFTFLLVLWTRFSCSNIQDTFDHDKGQKSAISGRRLHWIFLFSSGFPSFSPGFRCNFLTKIVDDPSTSYRIGKPTKCKNTHQHTQHETPRNTPSYTPWNTQKIRHSYFWGIFLVFSGYFFDLLV